MNQQDFDQATQGTFAQLVPFQGTGPYYKLIGITAEWKAPNPQILVTLLDSDGIAKTNVPISNIFPGDSENFPSRYPFTEFNLGAGSKTEHGQPGPHRIIVAGGRCDIVEGLGIPNLGRDGYVRFTLIYKLTDSVQPPQPGGKSDSITRAEAIASLDAIIATLTDIRDALIKEA